MGAVYADNTDRASEERNTPPKLGWSVTGDGPIMTVSTALRHGTRMHRFLFILGCTVVLLHALGGCCWHHAHAECVACQDDPPKASSCCYHHSHDEDDHRGSGGEQREQEHDRGCDTGSCDFVVPERETLVELGPDCVTALTAADTGTACLPTGFTGRSLELQLTRSSPPLRLYVLHQTLLL